MNGDESVGADASQPTPTDDRPDRLWLVERTYSDDELNVVILVYATRDGRRYHRMERALTSFERGLEVTAAIDVPDKPLGRTAEGDVERYAREAERMAGSHKPDDPV